MLGEKIYDYRKKNSMSQEVLAEKLGVARQTVSNWETGETSPNPEQLKLISQIFNVSIDELLDNHGFEKSDTNSNAGDLNKIGFEYKSKTMVKGLPLIHINIGGFVPRKAKGIIAIGDIAKGVVAIGGVSLGVLAVGGVGIGLVSIGGLAIGLITALGGGAIGAVACGGGAAGLIAYGGGALGLFSAGGAGALTVF